jgi:hypothetical protein
MKYESLDSNLDDLFARINKLTSEVMAEPKIEHKLEHKESLQVTPDLETLPLKKHAVSSPCKSTENFIEETK